MQSTATIELIRALAEANGLVIPEARLATVLRQYQNYMRTLDQLEALAPAREETPAILFSHWAGMPRRGVR